MVLSTRQKQAIYILVAVVALILTWAHILGPLGEVGFIDGTLLFWQDVLVNESSRFITVDILFLSLAVVFWMLQEARRLGMQGVWAYIAAGIFIGISCAVPLFLAHRERRLQDAPAAPVGQMSPLDASLIGLLAAGIMAYSLYSLSI